MPERKSDDAPEYYKGRSRNSFLGWIITGSLAVSILVRLLGHLDDPPPPLNDPAIRNIVTLLSLMVAGFASWVWFCFRTDYSLRLRRQVAIGTVLSLLLFVSVVIALRKSRILYFSGSLVPWIAKAEHTASDFSEVASTDVDLTSTTPEDFPQFLGPERNGWVGNVRLARDWQSMSPRSVWKRSIGAGWSSFAVTNGYAVTLEQRGEEEWVSCYEIASGNPVWGYPIAARHETALGGIGPRSTPTIHGGKVYTLGATGVLQCLSSNGELLWSDYLRKRYGVSDTEDEQNVMFGRAASPLIVGDLVVVPGGGPQGKARNLVAFDRRTGQVVWEAENRLPNGDAEQIAYASPTLATIAGREQILIVNESTVSGHHPANGERLWSYSWPGRSNGNASASQAVAVGENRVLLTKGYGGGAELIQLSGSVGQPMTIESLWKAPRVLQTKFSNVVVHKEYVYGLSEGILECVALNTGQRQWKKGRYGHGQILGADDLLLVLSEDGELHLMEMNPAEFTHLGSFTALEGKSWNNLCLYGKRLLVRNAQEAACFDLP